MPQGHLDRLSAVASLFGASMPVFWLGIVLMVVFALWLGWLPASGMFAPYGGGDLRDLLVHLALPAVTLAAASVTIIARLTRSTMLETLGQDYIRTARAKGMTTAAVVVRHGLRNALIPLVTVIALSLPGLVAGAVVTETIFAWPGMGRLFINALTQFDFALLMGYMMLVSFLVIFFNLVADLCYAWLDPRVKYT